MDLEQQSQDTFVSEPEQTSARVVSMRDYCDAINGDDISYFTGVLLGGVLEPAVQIKAALP
jgi:hypothetical protein